MNSELLKVENLKISFPLHQGKSVDIINRVDFALHRGIKTALVGESGCGKSVLSLALLGLLPKTTLVSGQAIFEGKTNILSLSEKSLNCLRGDCLVLVPQNPMSYLNPTLRVGYQMREGLKRKQSLTQNSSKRKVHELLSRVGFDDPKWICKRYPHQLSGGMAQRVLLAIGLMGKAKIVIADEPTRGLDSENLHRYLKLVRNLYSESCLLIITHQLEVAESCDQIMVMYGGEIIEQGPVKVILNQARHPYTRGLINAHPDKGMIPIPGQPLSFSDIPNGCRFHPRCFMADRKCVEHHPVLATFKDSKIRCHYVES